MDDDQPSPPPVVRLFFVSEGEVVAKAATTREAADMTAEQFGYEVIEQADADALNAEVADVYLDGDTVRRKPARPSPSHQWQAGAWVLDMAKAKAAKRAAINARREAEAAAPTLATPFGVFNADLLSRQKIGETLTGWQAVAALGAGPATIAWTLADDTQVVLSLNDLRMVAGLLLARGDAAHQTARALKAQVDAATTLGELTSIAWPSS